MLFYPYIDLDIFLREELSKLSSKNFFEFNSKAIMPQNFQSKIY